MEKTIFGVWRRTEWEWWMTLTVWLLNLNFSDHNDVELQMQISNVKETELENRGKLEGGKYSNLKLSQPRCVSKESPCSQVPMSECCHLSHPVFYDSGSGSGLGAGEDPNEGGFVIQSDVEPNESPPELPSGFLWPLVAGVQVPWSVAPWSVLMVANSWHRGSGGWHPPPGRCQTSTTSLVSAATDCKR